MNDQRGPFFRALTKTSGERRYWRYDHEEPDDGRVSWYFECARHNDEWWSIRQIAPHSSGVSAYDWEHLEDKHGFLTDQPVDEDEPLLKAIAPDEFERAWNETIRRRTDPYGTAAFACHQHCDLPAS